MALLRALLSLTVIAIMVKSAIGTNHRVGGASGWDLSSNVQAWAAGETFHVGDSLIFTYSQPHDVLEVTKADYDSCQATSALQVHSDGNTVITLTSPGNRYFICGFPEHCGQGMSLLVQTLATSTATPPSSPTATPPSTLPTVVTPPPSPAIAPSTLPKTTPAPSPSHPPSPSTSPSPSKHPLITPSLPPVRSVPKVFSIFPPSTSPAAASPSSSPSSAANRGHLPSKLTPLIWFGMSMLLAVAL